MKSEIHHYIKKRLLHDLAVFALVFCVYFFTAQIFLNIYYGLQTSPALIWPPVGIAFLAVIFGGYRMCIPIFLAQFLSVYLRAPGSWQIGLIIALGYALQAVVALYALKRYKFMEHHRPLNMLVFVWIVFAVTAIEPLIATTAQYFMHILSVSPTLNFGRGWGAGIFSVLVITPFVLTWYQRDQFAYSRLKKFELVVAQVLLVVMIYFLFWTKQPQNLGISVIFYLPAVLVWFAIQFPIRWLTLAIMLTSILGITGSIVAHPSSGALNVQLLSDEIYIGLVAAIFLIFTAVAEGRRSALLALKEAYRSTLDADQAKSEFIAILAHELRNPLAPLVSSIELLKLEPQTDEATENIKNIEEHAIMMSRILDDLLDIARLSQKKFTLNIEAIDLRDILDQSAKSVSDIMGEHQHTLTVVAPKDEMVLFADPVRIKQIVINLLNNSAKYTYDGGKIRLSAKKQGKYFRIQVSDNGRGIEADILPHIFEPFKQAGIHSKRGTGLGLGLFLTKNLVEMHDGKIEVESDGAGKGSMFTVLIPVSTQIPLQSKKEDTWMRSNSGEACNILIVDDNKAAADTLARLLRHHGHEVHVVYSGKEALVAFHSFEPEFILLDLQMPEMDGYEVAREIRGIGSAVKIVALSGYGQDADREHSKEAGFDFHLLKPVVANDILRILETTE